MTAQRIEKQVFKGLRLPSGAVVRDRHFVGCRFENSHVGLTGFTLVERVTFERCKVVLARLDQVICRDVLIDRTTHTLLPAANIYCDRVTLRGTCGAWLFEDGRRELESDELEMALDFYDGVEWALDIREAKFSSFDLRGTIPVEKIRRDPKRHYVMRLDRMRADARWKTLVKDIDHWESTLECPVDTTLSVPGDTGKFAPAFRAEHEALRAAGFAE